MKCDDAIRLIGKADDGRVGLDILDTLMTHLEHCVSCRSEAETQILVKRVLASRPDESIPVTLARRIAMQLDAAASRPARALVAWLGQLLARVRVKS
jgi:hypothetical protein